MENVNSIFAEFAACIAGTLDGEGEIVYPQLLDRSQLDYSLPSLKVVDEYLTYLHENRPEQMDREWLKAVLWGGAYVGEVIREYPDTTRLLGEEKQLGFCAHLTPGAGGFTLPVNKMLRFIHDGPEDSVYFYSACEVRER
jgi:hypothetical protein